MNSQFNQIQPQTSSTINVDSTDTMTMNKQDIFQNIQGDTEISNKENPDFDFVLDIPVSLTVELGQTRMAIKDLLQLTPGSVIELDGQAGAPLNVLINGCLIAMGEVVVINDKYGIRLTDIKSPSERVQKINR